MGCAKCIYISLCIYSFHLLSEESRLSSVTTTGSFRTLYLTWSFFSKRFWKSSVAKKLKKYNKLPHNIIQNEILAIFLNTDRIYNVPSILFKFLHFIRKKHIYKIQVQVHFKIFCFIIIKYSTFLSHYFSYSLRPYSVRTYNHFVVVLLRTLLSLIHVCVRAISARLTAFDLIGNLFIF